ncbi:MAG: hypothetical protein EH225_07945 [Calditrichaeota bacterium]|nr:hypothetical protein [Calditrichota bacterium]RQW02844.1 MAG: hypothetical protein EH225_07945 [Calditrichota bacterium]
MRFDIEKLKCDRVCLLIGLVFIFCVFCGNNSGKKNNSLLNFSHLEHLSRVVKLEGVTADYVGIYSEFPEYEIKEDPDEGITCVDDVSRAAVLYLRHYRYAGDEQSLGHARNLLNFILTMQSPKGTFYNFRFADMTINRHHQNSEARAGWWTWRAMWAMAEAYEIMVNEDPAYADLLKERIEAVFPAIDSLLQNYPRFSVVSGIELPTWLPFETAADQAGVLILGLVPYYRVTDNPGVADFIRKLAVGLLSFQFGNAEDSPYGCFLSWENNWHAYGNIQAYALLLAGQVLKEEEFLSKAFLEIENFYPYLIREGYLSYFELTFVADTVAISDIRKYPQIAYNFRPMVWASLEAYEVSGSEKYARQAGELACWLAGRNSNGVALYDPATGRCFDGINSEKEINRNSGAESTVEALLTILEIEQNPQAFTILKKCMENIRE